jgi:peptide/nickel transport system substrate-binding protein
MAPLLVAVSLVVAAGCGGSSSTNDTSSAATASSTSTAAAAVKKGGILRIGYTDYPDSLNPFVAYSAISYVIFTNIYPTLVQYDNSFHIVGDWASSWKASPDHLTWTFHLRPGTWSDGTKMTAADAAWTGNLILKYQATTTSQLAPFLAHATKLDAPSPDTLVIHYKKAVANVMPQLQQFFVLPEHVWAAHVGAQGKSLKNYDPAAKMPIVGGGSFYVSQYQRKGTTILKRNPGFYGTAPNVDAVGISYYDNSDAEIAAFKSNELDEVDAVPFTVIDQFKKNPSIILQTGPGTEVRDFGFNSNPKKTHNRELLNPKVRDAFAHAIDRNQMINVVFRGYAEPRATLLTPISAPYMNTKLKPETLDYALANKELDALGYKKGSDGIRVANGHKMSYEIITPNSVTGINREFDIVKTGLAKIGVQVTQRTLDGTTAFAEITKPNNKYLDFDMHMWDWVGYIDPDFVLSVMTCGQYGGWSDTAYCNHAYDKLYSQQGVTLSGPARKQIVWKMQDMLYHDKPYIQLAQLDLVEAFQKSWGGFTKPFLNGMGKLPWIEIHRV